MSTRIRRYVMFALLYFAQGSILSYFTALNALYLLSFNLSIRRDPQLDAFVRDTLSLNIVRGGYQVNVIPETAAAQLDCRLLPGTDPAAFDAWLARRLGRAVTFEVVERSPRTASSPAGGLFYEALSAAVRREHPAAGVFPMQMSGATDGRFWRARGTPVYGLSPFLMTRADIGRIHGIDECISGANLAQGVRIAQDVMRAVCCV